MQIDRVQIDCEALCDSLVLAWEQSKGQHAQRLRDQMIVKPRRRNKPQSTDVQCPHCFEWSPVAAEFDEKVDDVLYQDCPVCCRPWQVHVFGDAMHRNYEVRNPEG